jgi:hypothetical protein
MRRLLRIALAAVSIGFMAWIAAGQWPQVSAQARHFDPLLFLPALAGLVALFFLDAYGWHLILGALGQRPPLGASLRVWILSSVTRYLPGGVWAYLSRAALAKEAGVDLAAAGVSLYLETLLLAASSLAVGLPALLAAADVGFHPWLAVVFLALLGLLMHPRLLRLSRRLPGRVGLAFALVPLPTLMRLIRIYIYYVVFWALMGGAFFLFISSFHPLSPAQGLQAASALALAFFIGFVVFFFPGGIGIREGALLLLLSPILPPEVAVLAAVGSRLWIMLGEGLSLGLILLIGKGKK